MKPQKAILRETAHIALGTVILTAVMIAVFTAAGYFDLHVLLGGLLGALLAVGNFFFLGLTLQRITDTANGNDPDEVKSAKLRIRADYTRRTLIVGALAVVGIAVLKFSWIAVLCPLIFPRITIFAMTLFKSKGTVKGSDIK